MTQLSSLKDLYIDQLQDLYSADRQSLSATKKLVNEAKSEDLRRALERGVEGISEGAEQVAKIIRKHDADPTGEFCKGMEGIVKEIDAHVFDAQFTDDDVKDAMIIAQYQRMTHYGVAGYGTVLAYARRLGLQDDAKILETCLDNTYGGDKEMTRIAEGSVNAAAA